MTVKGAEALRDELNELKSVTRPKITAAIAEAREHGDLKENAEYHAAREQQSFCEGRIKEIEGKLADAEIIDVSKIKPSGRVIFGTTVTLYNLETEESVTYQIVGEDEDASRILEEALGKAIYRVVVKRPTNADYLAMLKPNYSLEGKSTRYDIFAKQKLPK